jgi:serine phosphatase RsbU (regulator of sigma subunit)
VLCERRRAENGVRNEESRGAGDSADVEGTATLPLRQTRMALGALKRRRFPLSLIATLGFLLIVVILLVASGLFVRSIVADSFRNAQGLRAARVLAGNVLKEQLDEETGVRGYAALRQKILLQPYDDARRALPLSLGRLRRVIEERDVRETLPALHDAAKANRRWVTLVALPLLAHRRPTRALELHGKALIDRFRIDLAEVDGRLAHREVLSDQRAQDATLLVGFFSAAAVAAVVAAALIFTVQQYRLGARLERARAASEEERRRLAEVRAAYETEKRIADTLQEAFGERVLPALPAVAFSATYIPASEETKIGGDWYDALQLSEGRVLLAIGDVAGHGIDAVVAMNKARQLLISCALLDATPHRVLERVNAELVRGKSPIITALSAIFDARTLEFAYATAGHPPPVLFEPGRRARLLEFGSLPLGVAAMTGYQTHRIKTVPGAMIVLYTDGVIEHSRDLAQGEASLLEAVESAAQRPQDDAAKVIRDAIFNRRKVADDVAILTVHLSDPNALRRTA